MVEAEATLAALMGAPLPAELPSEVTAALRPTAPPGTVVEADADARPTAVHALVERPWETWHILALFNWRSGARLAVMPLEKLGLPPGGEWLVHDFWGKASLGLATLAVGRRLPGRSCVLLGLRANTGRPQVVGTDRHVTMGAAELDDVAWDPGTRTLRGRAAPEPFTLMVRSPHPLVPMTSSGGEVGPLAEARFALALPAATTWRPWSITFAEAPPPPRGQPIRLLLD